MASLTGELQWSEAVRTARWMNCAVRSRLNERLARRWPMRQFTQLPSRFAKGPAPMRTELAVLHGRRLRRRAPSPAGESPSPDSIGHDLTTGYEGSR